MGSIATTSKPFPGGIHVPSLTWFANDANQEIDWDVQKKHIEFLISSGLDGSMFRRMNHMNQINKLQSLLLEQTERPSHSPPPKSQSSSEPLERSQSPLAVPISQSHWAPHHKPHEMPLTRQSSLRKLAPTLSLFSLPATSTLP